MSEEELNSLNNKIEEALTDESALPETGMETVENTQRENNEETGGANTETKAEVKKEDNNKKKKKKRKRKRNRRISTIILLLLALVCVGAAIYFFFFYNYNAYRRQSIEESLADVFINDLIEEGLSEETESEDDSYTYTPDYSTRETETATVDENGIIQMGNIFDYSDDIYYERNGVTYTPDYAEGDLLFVLEFPVCGIRRGVYGGTWDEIYHDLDIWMVTIARPDMKLGETHISIYGHNHTSQNLSFNNLKAAQIGDEFYLYAYSGVYTYEVTNIFSEWRTSTTTKYVDDFSISADICYIITCGRDNFLINGESTRYKDYIVEGHLVEKKSLSQYAYEVINGETY